MGDTVTPARGVDDVYHFICIDVIVNDIDDMPVPQQLLSLIIAQTQTIEAFEAFEAKVYDDEDVYMM